MISSSLRKAARHAVALLFVVSGCSDNGAPEASRRPEASGGDGIFSVRLVPERPAAGDKIKVVVDGDADEVSFLWEVNGKGVEAPGDTIEKGMFRKGDVVRVRALSGDIGSEASVEVVNTPPSLVSVRINPAEPRAGMDLSAEVEGYDADGDPLRYDFLWSVNGLSFYGDVLSGSNLSRGDAVTLRVRAFDGEDESEPLEVSGSSAGNSPPNFVSTPPSAFSKHFIYEVKAEDPDGDEITFVVVKGPKGMEVKGGRIEWEATGEEGVVDVTLSAEDGRGGSALQSFRLTIGRENGDGQ